MNLYLKTNNIASAVKIADIPTVEYLDLYKDLVERMQDKRYHIAHYFATEVEKGLKFFILLYSPQGLQTRFRARSSRTLPRGEEYWSSLHGR